MLLISFNLVACVTLGQPEGISQPDDGDFATTLREATCTEVDFSTSFEVLFLPSRPVSDNSPWDAASAWQREEVGVTVVGQRLRQDLFRVNADGSRPYRLSLIWDGAREYSWFPPPENVVTIASEAGPVDARRQAFMLNLLDGRFGRPGIALSELTQRLELMHQEEGDGWTRAVYQGDGNARYTIELERGATPKLVSVLLELTASSDPHAEDAFSADLAISEKLVMQDWEEYGASLFPSRAYVEVVSHDPRQGWVKTRFLYTRTNFELLTDMSDMSPFEAPWGEGTKVADANLNLSYEIGGDYLWLDGAMYLLRERIREHPGDRLPELLQSAVLMREKGAAIGAQLAQPRKTMLNRVVIGSLAGACAGVVLVLVCRRFLAQRRGKMERVV